MNIETKRRPLLVALALALSLSLAACGGSQDNAAKADGDKTAEAKDKPVDILKAASRKMNSLTNNAVWVVHPESDEFSYTTSMKLATGYPVRNNLSQKVVSVVNDEATAPLTVKDAKIALSLGLDVDYDSVEQ